jgi:hypothetical protein
LTSAEHTSLRWTHIRRECLDHVVIFDERHLRRTLSSYVQSRIPRMNCMMA